MHNKQLRQASLTTTINQIISVPDLIPIILEYSADYTAEEARQYTGKAAKDGKQADEESTHTQMIVMNNTTSSQSVAIGFFRGSSNVNSSNADSHAPTAGSDSSEGIGFFKINRATIVAKDSQPINGQQLLLR